MDMRYLILLCSTFILVASSGIYGVKFLRKGNVLLGVEWLIVTFSGSNFLFFFLTDVQAAYSISYFCDAFSRGFGIPVITTAGLMAVTHYYRPSMLTDVWLFVGAIAGTVILVASEAVAPLKPWFYLAMWMAFSCYLVYFARRLLNVGEGFHALAVLVVMVLAQTVATIYDFYTIPGDREQVLFYIFAGLTWSLLCVEMYYAYCALERGEKRASSLDQGSSLSLYI